MDIAAVGQNDRVVVVLTVTADLGPQRPGHGRRSDPGGLRDRESEYLGEWRGDRFRLARCRAGRGPHRSPHRPLRCGDRSRRRRSAAVQCRLRHARGFARRLSPSPARRSRICTGPICGRAPRPGLSRWSARRGRRQEQSARVRRHDPGTQALAARCRDRRRCRVRASPPAWLGSASRSSVTSRRACRRRRILPLSRHRRLSWIATGGCSARSRSPTAAGGCRSPRRMSINGSSTC